MKFIKKAPLIRLLGAFALGSLGFISSAQAGVITYSTNWSLNDTIINLSNTSGTVDGFYDVANLSINKFNSGLGTLTGVEVVYTRRLSGSMEAVFVDEDSFGETSGEQQFQNVTTEISGLTGVAPSTLTYGGPVKTCSDSSAFSDAVCSTSDAFGTSITSINTTITSGLFGAYTGLGSLSFTSSLSGLLSTFETDGDDGYVDFRRGDLVGLGYLEVTYTYDEPIIPPISVPEPGIFGMFSLSALLLFVRRRTLRAHG